MFYIQMLIERDGYPDIHVYAGGWFTVRAFLCFFGRWGGVGWGGVGWANNVQWH